MEFGVSAPLQCGGNVVGVSWTTPSNSPMGDATQLVTTTNTRVQIHAADDQRIVASWLTRPGSANRFVVAAVQHRSSRQLFTVQDGNRLLAWHERQTSLDAAVSMPVRRDVYALRVSKHLPAIFVIYRDGGISVFSLKLEELFYAEGVAHVAQPAKASKGSASATADGPLATWARLTSIPTEPGKVVLMVAVQSPASPGGAASATLLRVFTASAVRAQQGQASSSASTQAQLLFEHRASHHLHAPSGASASCRTSSLTLHKHFQALTAVWTDGTMQVLRFHRVPGMAAGPQWYTLTPQVIATRHLGTTVPGATASAGSSTLQVASFALEPSCLVMAGSARAADGRVGVYMTVWDVRYAVILGTKEILVEGSADSGAGDDVAPAVHKNKRQRSSSHLSTGSAVDDATSGSFARSAAAVSGSGLAPASVFQVTVNEDGSFVACVSREGVHVTPVAVRGASLASALGRLPSTLTMINGGASSAGNALVVPPEPVLQLDHMLCSTSTSSLAGDGRLTAGSASTWATAAATAQSQLQQDCEAVADRSKTRTITHVAAILSRYGVLVDSGAAAGVGSSTAVAPSTAEAESASKKRKRGKDKEEKAGASGIIASVSSAAPLAAPLAPAVAVTLPYALAIAAVQRCVDDLRHGLQAKASSGSTSAASNSEPSAYGVAFPVLTGLIRANAISVAASPSLIPALIEVTVLAPIASRQETMADGQVKAVATPAPAAVEALAVLCDLLLHASDIPETCHVSIFKAALHRMAKATLAALWTRTATAAQAASRMLHPDGAFPASGGAGSSSSAPAPRTSHQNRHVLGLLYVTGLIVRAPRNDVFQEAALTALQADDVRALLACLLRLLHAHAENSVHARPVISAQVLEDTISVAQRGAAGGKGKKSRQESEATEGLPRTTLSLAPKHVGKGSKSTASASAGGAGASAPAGSEATGAAVPASASWPLASHLPSYGQVLDWLRMVIDSHFARIVLLAKSDVELEGNRRAASTYGLLVEVARIVKAQVSLSAAAAPLRGHCEHLLRRLPLPAEPEPDYTVAVLRV